MIGHCIPDSGHTCPAFAHRSGHCESLPVWHPPIQKQSQRLLYHFPSPSRCHWQWLFSVPCPVCIGKGVFLGAGKFPIPLPGPQHPPIPSRRGQRSPVPDQSLPGQARTTSIQGMSLSLCRVIALLLYCGVCSLRGKWFTLRGGKIGWPLAGSRALLLSGPMPSGITLSATPRIPLVEQCAPSVFIFSGVFHTHRVIRGGKMAIDRVKSVSMSLPPARKPLIMNG